MKPMKTAQSGVFLLEALIGVLVFSIGVLAMVALASTAVAMQADAQYRAEAMNLAQRLSSDIWTGVDRTKETVNGAEMSVVTATSLQQYQHAPGGSDCAFTGADSTRQVVLDWADAVRAALPGSGNGMQQIAVDAATSNQARITICWQAPTDNKIRQYTLVTYVN